MITPNIIRKIIEDSSEFKDLSIKNRKRKFVDAKTVYYYFCDKYLDRGKFSMEAIAAEIKQDHCSYIHAKKSFYLIGEASFLANEIYRKTSNRILYFTENKKIPETLESIKADYDFKILELQNQLNEVKRRNNVFSDEIIDKINDLSPEAFHDLLHRVTTFLKVNEKLSNKIYLE